MAPTTSIVCLPDICEQVSGSLSMDFLLPNGIFIQLAVDLNKPLDYLKLIIWDQAKKLPLYNKLMGKERYIFEYLNRDGEREEVTDESLRLSEIRPIGRFLRLQERKDEGDKNTLDKQISLLLGNKNLMEMHAIPRAEVDDFRKKILLFASRVPRNKSAFEKRFPLQLRSSDTIPDDIRNRLNNGYLVVSVQIEEVSIKFHLQCHIEESPELIIDNAIHKWHNRRVRNSYDYILKVVGQEEYLYGKSAIHNFKYIYNCIQKNVAPQFWLISKKAVWSDEAPNRPAPSLPKPPRPHPSLTGHSDILVWDIDQNFEVKVNSITNIEITSVPIRDSIDKVKLFVGLYHGNEVLGNVMSTGEMPVVHGNCEVNMPLTFELAVKDMQTASRLCVTLHGRMRGTKGLNPIAWVNLPVFDFRSRLLLGEQTLAMWPVTAELQLEETGCYPLGSVSLNPHGTMTLTVNFSDYNRSPPIVFPPDNKIMDCAADNMEPSGTQGAPDWRLPARLQSQLATILESRQWETLHEQDKDLVWLSRLEIREKYSDCLPLVLRSVKWANHADVAKMQVLLSTWPQKIPVDSALELLDFNFPDKNVRKYAVDCLQELRDDEVMLYLLQLVQALKYENYLYCPLAEFLLQRALSNQHIGHKLFWLLKSELHNPTVTVRFGLLLEAYLKMSPDHLYVLTQQIEALCKLNALSQIVLREQLKNYKNMRDILMQKSFQEKLSNILSPLSPLYKLKELRLDQCKFMDSKKRPLYLVWTNADSEGQEIHIIYKSGDDLRQDMLTLQMLEVMDSIWQAEGLDLRINAYGCVATGMEQGMIEVVRNSKTLAAIQKESSSKSAFDKKSLWEWLEQKHKDPGQLEMAVEEFLLSCAGYTVATYILGVGDRHNDNIMLKENGQLFHIDFGHFLGNFKSKLGVKRERVPVVLTTHFEYIITKGDKDKENYTRFKKMCTEAYLALRRRGHLLIRLFMMMLNSGIPQLSSISDLDYIKKETLVLHLTEQEAIKHFQKKLEDSLKSLSTKFNWMIHNMAHAK
ncbi:phosphatidylinositol 4,5-bisphosphate 3-kinase catalytic subunit delta isoform-like isoform X3 [Mya arenaria]|uniref:phosphatidylinositol 4,5-bisphosphate 3-kinase catalytic subunit delta isoform-like isoform X3 n=1 Tax=Mya arenaria TaxID=6604 RepID=UPI0022E6E6B1|nr:phosphatidylinositol 4,5-bisphosphate 3-kinase catalytic subunit delta isoform-like isoform X3 [Mya arenaria]